MTWNGINITSRSKEKGDFALVKDTNSNEFHEKILSWIQKLKFKKKVFGGVDEVDVLKKMEELNSLYEKALLAERARYNTLLETKSVGGAAHED